MKKFISTSPYQPRFRTNPKTGEKLPGLVKGIYNAADNQILAYNTPTSFPIITAINGYVEKGEEIEIITIVPDYENANYNYGHSEEEIKALSQEKGFPYTLEEGFEELLQNREFPYTLKEEIEALSQKKGFTYTLKEVRVPYNNAIDTELALFSELIDCTADEDTLFACLTYGSKPFPLVQIMALNYAHRIRKNVSIGCIVYGGLDHNNGNMEVYDITSLLYIDEAVRLMAEQKIENPTELIKNLLK